MRKLCLGILLLISTASMGQIIPGVVASSMQGSTSTLLNGLIGYWKFDESSGTLYDAHASYDGSPTSITYSQNGIINTALSFNGTSSAIDFGTGIGPTSALSISVWMKTTTAAEQALIDHTGYTTNWQGFRLTAGSDGNVYAMLCNNTATYFDSGFDPSANIYDGNYHHIVITWNGTTVYFYVDNQKSSGASYSTDINYESGSTMKAGVTYAGSFDYTGVMDEVATANRAWTDAEVTTLYGHTAYPF